MGAAFYFPSPSRKEKQCWWKKRGSIAGILSNLHLANWKRIRMPSGVTGWRGCVLESWKVLEEIV